VTIWRRFLNWLCPPRFIVNPEYGQRAYNMLYSATHPQVEAVARSVIGPSWKGDDSVQALRAWVRDAIWYAADAFDTDFWQTPELTLERRRGDCEDKALLLVAMIHAVAPAEDRRRVRFVVGAVGDKGHATVGWLKHADNEWYNMDPETGRHPWLFRLDRMFQTHESANVTGVWRHRQLWSDKAGFWPS
jgi:hypothetical protein